MLQSEKDGTSDESSRRNRSISLAVLTSLASKFGTLFLQFFSIPLAYKTLGEEQFGLYATIAVSVGTLILCEFGIGPALTHGLSRAVAKKDKLLEKQYFSTSWFLIASFALLAGTIASCILLFVPLTFFFGDKYSGFEGQLIPGLWLAVFIVLIEFVTSHTDKARAGFLQVHINNAFGAVGNVISAATIVIGLRFFPTIEFLILAVFGVRSLTCLANTIHFYCQRPDLLPNLKFFDKPLSKEIFSDGIAFTVSYSLTTIIELNVCGLLVARIAGFVEVGRFQILMQLSTLMLGLIMMFTTPTMPAIVDALARRDLDWIKTTLKRLWLLVFVIGAGAIGGLTLLGPTILPLLYGESFAPSLLLLAAFATYFAISAWGHVNNMVLIGLGLVKKAAVISLIETLLLLIPAGIGMSLWGLPGLFTGMFGTMLCITVWLFPKMILKKLKSESKAPSSPASPEPI